MNGSQSDRRDGNPAVARDFGPSVPNLGETGSVRAAWGSVLALLPVLVGAFLVARERPLDVSRPGACLAVLLAGGGWWLALAAARRAAPVPGVLAIVLAGAVALRLLFLASDTAVTDDLHRYVWEGALLAEGESPYALAPVERAAERARWGELYARVNHPEVPAAYPPLTLLVQAALVRAAGGAEEAERARFVLRVAYLLCDLAVCVPLWFLARARRLAPAVLVAWAWNPWVALESAGAGHFDALGILALVLALAWWARPLLCGVALALGAGVKLLPLALAPFLLRSRGRAGVALAAGLVVPVALFVAGTGAWPAPRGLSEYAFRWESFSLVHRWIEGACARFAPYDEGWSDPRRLARGLALVLWSLPLLWAFRARLAPTHVALVAVGGFLVFTPTLHPWYVCWVVPFLTLHRARSLELLAALSPLLYWPLAGWRARGEWLEPVWLWPLVALPFFAFLALDLRRGRARGVR